MATSLVVWGVFVRLVFVLHSTWLVNSASHMWGYRNYETTDDSRNNWWVALLTYGEGWHNNHHAYPRMALHGHRWWELDLTFRTIRLMQRLGLAWDVVDYKRGGAARESSTPAHG
jgi:stearoyl-CoA desaturase (delta-9 desaturase)